MGRVQLFEVSLSHGRVVYSPGEPLAGAVRVRLGAPLPFRGGRGGPLGGGPGRQGSGGCAAPAAGSVLPEAAAVALGLDPRGWIRGAWPGPASCRPLPSPPGGPGSLGPRRLREGWGAAGREAQTRPGGWLLADGAEQGSQGGPVLPHVPFLFCLLGSARAGGGGLDLAHLAEGHSDLDTCTHRPSLSGLQGRLHPTPAGPSPGAWPSLLGFLSHTPRPLAQALNPHGPAVHPFHAG